MAVKEDPARLTCGVRCVLRVILSPSVISLKSSRSRQEIDTVDKYSTLLILLGKFKNLAAGSQRIKITHHNTYKEIHCQRQAASHQPLSPSK